MPQLATATNLLFMLSYSNKCIRLLIYIFRHMFLTLILQHWWLYLTVMRMRINKLSELHPIKTEILKLSCMSSCTSGRDLFHACKHWSGSWVFLIWRRRFLGSRSPVPDFYWRSMAVSCLRCWVHVDGGNAHVPLQIHDLRCAHSLVSL